MFQTTNQINILGRLWKPMDTSSDSIWPSPPKNSSPVFVPAKLEGSAGTWCPCNGHFFAPRACFECHGDASDGFIIKQFSCAKLGCSSPRVWSTLSRWSQCCQGNMDSQFLGWLGEICGNSMKEYEGAIHCICWTSRFYLGGTIVIESFWFVSLTRTARACHAPCMHGNQRPNEQKCWRIAFIPGLLGCFRPIPKHP